MTVRNRIPLKEDAVPELTKYLLYAFDVDADPFAKFGVGLSEAEVQKKLGERWKIHGRATIKHFIESEGPGYRPQTFWRCESPEPRPEIIFRGGSPGGDPYAADRALRRAQEIDILFRHGLLTKEEGRSLSEENLADFGYLSSPAKEKR